MMMVYDRILDEDAVTDAAGRTQRDKADSKIRRGMIDEFSGGNSKVGQRL
jgi:hypothetical protein